jgi:pyruvate,water dikinase
MTSLRASSLTLNLDSPEATLDRVGGKGASLARMLAAGLPVPPGFHITTDAYRRFVEENHLGGEILSAVAQAQANDPATLDRASEQIQSLIAQAAIPGEIAGAIILKYRELGADLAVAVRSSATAEDLPGMSFAGQLDTYLNVRGGDQVIDAVKRCWASLWTGRAIGYRQRQGIRPEDVSIAVVVQQLVPAEVAGAAFTANPVTGARDEIVINAAWGLGEAIVGGAVTPDTITINKETGAIASQEIAAKDVMTVRLDEGTHEEPVPQIKRMKPSLDPAQAKELARLGIKIEQLYGQPMDIEWAMCDGRLFILQARPVTALPEARPSLEWKLPRAKARYFRQSVAELLPEPLSPLFATLALPAWDAATTTIMAQALGIRRGEFPLLTIHNYAYYEIPMSAMLRVLVSMPLRGRTMARMFRTAEDHWANGTRPLYAELAGAWTGRDLAATPAAELLKGAQEIVGAAAEYYLSVQMVLAMANMSEATFTGVYNRLIKRKSDPPALTFLLGFSSEPIRAEKSLYDLAMWAQARGELAAYLARTESKEIAAAIESGPEPSTDRASWHEFKSRLTEHLNRFGHAVYDLDFAKSVPAEDPASQLETLKFFLAGQGRNPYQRQAAATEAREEAANAALKRVGPLRRRMLKRSLRWAQRWVPLREESLADVGLGWPVLRRMLREIGSRMVAAGAIDDGDEVFWLKWEELEDATRRLESGQLVEDCRPAIAERQKTWQSERAVAPPVVLPIKGGAKVLGIDFSSLMPARTSQDEKDVIRGIGASPGKVTGPASVIHGPEEFDRMKPGDILVARITTPAWTPLFALASGIVTDVGGPLSHSSIVAREYGVPAVLGTGVATRRIHSGEQISVDGDHGQVELCR